LLISGPAADAEKTAMARALTTKGILLIWLRALTDDHAC
jgi:hypothetical protein